jgi:hypothetical protein
MRSACRRHGIRLPRRLRHGALNAGEERSGAPVQMILHDVSMWAADRTASASPAEALAVSVLKLLRRWWHPLAKLALAGPKPVVSGASVCLQRLRCRLWPRSARHGLSDYTGDWRDG